MFRIMIFLVACLFSISSIAQTRIVPHITAASGGFSSTVQVTNQGGDTQTFTLTAYDTSGHMLTPYMGSLSGGSTFSQDVTTLFAEGDQVSHFTIAADDSIKVSVAYGHKTAATSPAHVVETNTQASSFRISAGNWDLVFDGIAVVNMGSEPSDLWVAQRDFEGNFIKSIKVAEQLAPKAKALFVVGSPDSDVFTSGDSVYELSADQHLSVTALRGTLGRTDTGLLWANHAEALSASTSTRDDKGIWFIEDGSLYDVFEKMGYNIAVDRLWQLQLFTYRGMGRLAEVFGANFVGLDRQVRRTNYSAEELDLIFADLDPETQTIINAYIAGINRRISQVASDASLLPYEFTELGLTGAEPWNIETLMNWTAQTERSFSLVQYGIAQIENVQLLQNLITSTGNQLQAAQMMEDLRVISDPRAPTMVHPETGKSAELITRPFPMLDEDAIDTRAAARQLREEFDRGDELLKSINAYIKGGSFAWVVSGDRTESGNPILYSGPQLGSAAPNTLVEGSIKSDAMTVSGMSMPGIPGILVGRTPHHAWSFQVGAAHSFDYYVENTADDEVVVRTETIKVRDGEDVLMDIRHSAHGHGPIITDAPLPRFAWKYAHWGKEWDFSKGILGLARAQSMEEFGEAVSYLGASQHICYADKDNNIAYWLSGKTPTRTPGEYRIPQGLLGPPLEWDADVLEPLIHDSNPEEGWYGGWNNKPSPEYQDNSGLFTFGAFHRAHVVHDNFNGRTEKFSFEEVRDISIDLANSFSLGRGGNPWTQVKERFTAVVEANPTEERLAALSLFEGWNGKYTEDDVNIMQTTPHLTEAWVLTRDWVFDVLNQTFNDEIGFNPFVFEANNRFQTYLNAIEGNTNHNWFENLADPEAAQTADDIILLALDNVLGRLGEHPWGQNQRLPIFWRHNVTSLNTVNCFEGMDRDPVNAMFCSFFLNRADYGQCVEVGEFGPVRIETTMPLGQSGLILADEDGNPAFGPHFWDRHDAFQALEHRAFPLFQ